MTKSVAEKSGKRAGEHLKMLLDHPERLDTYLWWRKNGSSALDTEVIEGRYDRDQLIAILEHRNAVEIPGWIRQRTKDVRERLQSIEKDCDLSLFETTLKHCGKEQIEAWKKIGFGVTYLPEAELGKNHEFWEKNVRPGDFLYKQSQAGNILLLNPEGELVKDERADWLGGIGKGIVVLFDTRQKPAFTDGSQMWKNDENCLGAVIAKLREEGKIQGYDWCPQGSRFGVTVQPGGEWYKHVRPAQAELLGPRVDVNSVRFETAMESIVLSQMYPDLPRGKDGETNTLAWYEQFFGDDRKRLNGGGSDYGGLANVYWYDPRRPWVNISFRPLAVLAA